MFISSVTITATKRSSSASTTSRSATVALSAEVAQFGVLVNSVCPGFINTELTASVLSEVELNDLISKVPARRLGTPIEVAELVGWLSGPSNTFVSGQSIVIDGGYTCV